MLCNVYLINLHVVIIIDIGRAAIYRLSDQYIILYITPVDEPCTIQMTGWLISYGLWCYL